MLNPAHARRSILLGVLLSAFGIILYTQLGSIVELRVGLTVLNTATILSFFLTLLGLLAILIGGVAWARRAPLASVILSGGSVGVVAFLLAELVDINVHGPTAILMFVVFACALGCVLILGIAASRFLYRDGSTHTDVT
jgi:hypothetical protein